MDSERFPEFRPHPLLRSGHAQTIVGAYLRSPLHVYAAVRRTVKLDDGDYIVLHDDAPSSGLVLPEPSTSAADEESGPATWRPGQRVVLLIHGLGGSFRTGYMPRVASRLNLHGWRTIRMDLRGWGAGLGLARRAGHAGRSEDVAAALRYVARLCPGSPISLVGFSLGGNLALKMVGEMGSNVPPGLDSVMAVAPPIDLVRCAHNIKQGINWIYDRSFMRALRRNILHRKSLLPRFDGLQAESLPRTLYDFDDKITAPLSGFVDAEDYYTRASATHVLRRVCVPTLIVSAEDDPIIPVEIFHEAKRSPCVNLHLTRHGGHLGFVGRADTDPDHRWLDWRVVQWVQQVEALAHQVVTRAETALNLANRGGDSLDVSIQGSS
jgi:predicted alpha/beta-fold hydrolase